MPPLSSETIDKFCEARIGTNSIDKVRQVCELLSLLSHYFTARRWCFCWRHLRCRGYQSVTEQVRHDQALGEPLVCDPILHRNITRIVNTCARCPSLFTKSGIDYLSLNLLEVLEEDDIDQIVEALSDSLTFIRTILPLHNHTFYFKKKNCIPTERARSEGRTVLIHDVAGQVQGMGAILMGVFFFFGGLKVLTIQIISGCSCIHNQTKAV